MFNVCIHALVRVHCTHSISLLFTLHTVCGAYGAALKLYLEAGSVTSDHFTKLVPDKVWTPAVYRNMMNCCSELQLPVHVSCLPTYVLHACVFTGTVCIIGVHTRYVLNMCALS